jgi:hypothetical protein
MAWLISRLTRPFPSGWMDVIETMMRGGKRQDGTGCAHRFEAEVLLVVCHAVSEACAGGRHVTANGVVVLWSRPPLPWCHDKRPAAITNSQHIIRSAVVERAVQSGDERARGRLRQRLARREPIDLGLHTNMRHSLALQVAAPFVLVEIAR